MTAQIYEKYDHKTTGGAIRDITHWMDYLEHQSKPLEDLIKRQMQRIEKGGAGARYAQRDLEAITKAFEAHIEFRNAMVDHLNDLADAYLTERAGRKAHEKRADRLFDLAFSGTMDLYRQLHGRPAQKSLRQHLKNRVAS